MESLGTDLVDQEISVFGMKAVTEEIGECESWVDWRWRSAQMGLGPFHSFHGFHSHILLHQIEVFDWLDPAVVG